MRYVVFPTYECKDEVIPALHTLVIEPDIIVAGPTASGLYLVEGSEVSLDLLKFMAKPYYLFVEDFDVPVIH